MTLLVMLLGEDLALEMRALMVTQAVVSASCQGLWRGQHALGLCWEQDSCPEEELLRALEGKGEC